MAFTVSRYSLQGSALTTLMAVSVVAALILVIYTRWFYVDFPELEGIPEAPHCQTLAGHFYALGDDHAKTAEIWAKKYDWPVFQFRMGNRRAIMLNSFEAARDWIIKNQAATLDRPWFYTFHGVVSATSAATIGTSPWNERCKKQRRVVGSFTTAPEIKRLQSVIDVETASVVSRLYYDSGKGSKDIEPHIYQKRLSLNIMMMFCYRTRFSSTTDPLLLQILEDATTIASFRSTKSNPQDFMPYLRFSPANARTATAKEVRARRDKWLAAMLDSVRDSFVETASSKKCVAEMLLSDSQGGLTTLDIRTILGGLMSGGFETLYSTAIITIGVLSTKEGQDIQKAAYDDLLSVYGSVDEAFDHCLTEEKSPYIVGLYKEALRFYPPIKLLPARQTYKDFNYNGSAIPKGILIYINAQAINRDKNIFGPDADKFRPTRWTDKENTIPPPQHFAFGAGARMCTAVNFSNRVLYALFARLILSFSMSESQTSPPNTHYIDYKRDPAEGNAIASPFKVVFTPRDESTLITCLGRSQEQLKELTPGMNAEQLVES